MTMMTSAKGITKDIDLDVDAICAYEAEHPDWSIFQLLEKMKSARFTDMDLLARFLGYDGFKAWAEDGYNFEDMAAAVQGSKYLGFTGTASTDAD